MWFQLDYYSEGSFERVEFTKENPRLNSVICERQFIFSRLTRRKCFFLIHWKRLREINNLVVDQRELWGLKSSTYSFSISRIFFNWICRAHENINQSSNQFRLNYKISITKSRFESLENPVIALFQRSPSSYSLSIDPVSLDYLEPRISLFEG